MRPFHLNSIVTVAAFLCFFASRPAISQAGFGENSLKAYDSCSFSDGLQVVRTDSLPPGVTMRPVETDTETRQIEMLAGHRIMFAYPNTDFYANVKAEILPARNFIELKRYLLENFEHMAHGNKVNTTMATPLNGFEVHGLDRDKLEGGVLGVYLLFDDPAHSVTTIYLLNQEPQDRKFQTIEEYQSLRDRFLKSYSTCIRENQKRAK
jgi:hypothetical protein